MLLQDGYAGLTMRRIAKAVGCTPTSIYLYFRNKDALVHELIDEGMSKLHEQLVSATAGVENTTERLYWYARAYIDFALSNPEYYEVMFLLRSDMERYPAELYRRARNNLEIIAESLATQSGERDPLELLTAVSVLWSMVHGAVTILLARRLDYKIDRETFCDRVARHAALLARDAVRPDLDIQ